MSEPKRLTISGPDWWDQCQNIKVEPIAIAHAITVAVNTFRLFMEGKQFIPPHIRREHYQKILAEFGETMECNGKLVKFNYSPYKNVPDGSEGRLWLSEAI